MKMKKSIFISLLVCLLSLPCFCGEVSEALQHEITNLKELEQNYNQLQNDYEAQTKELNSLKMDLPKLEMDLTVSTEALERITQDFTQLSKDYKSLQTKSNILKIGCITLGITTAVAVPLLIWSFNNRKKE